MTDQYTIAADELIDILSLDCETGILRWKARPIEMFSGDGWMRERAAKTWNTRFAGKEASSYSAGYLRVSINGRSLKAHRVILAIITGKWPDGDVDHINGDTLDNRPSNLRAVSHVDNCRNQKLRCGNIYGMHGINVDRRTGKFVVAISDSGEKRHIGQYADLASARIAREAAQRALNYHKNHGRTV